MRHATHLLRGEHQHHAGDESEDGVEREGVLPGMLGMPVHEHFESDEHCAERVEDPPQAPLVGGPVEESRGLVQPEAPGSAPAPAPALSGSSRR